MEIENYLTLLGFGIIILIFIAGILISNVRFKHKQELNYAKFMTATQLKLTQFDLELTALKEKIQLNKTEIIDTYKQYKNETIEHTLVFRNETNASLKENKDDHAEIHNRLTTVLADLSFIKGKLSHTNTKLNA